VDNGSIYTKNLVDFLTKKETQFIDQKFDEVDLSDIGQFNSFILSGRRKNNQKMNAINSQIIKHTVSEKKSLLGICYGAEILALTLGGTIRKSPKPVKGEEIIVKMVEGKVKKFLSEVSLTEQDFVKDPGLKIKSLLDKNQAEVIQFKRFEVGEGIEKRADSFAEEVMSQAKGS